MSPPEPSTSRLATAIRLGLEFRAARRTDVAAFLAAHEELRELLEPIVGMPTPTHLDPRDAVAPSGADEPASQGTLFGGYRIEQELGRGGMGTVYAAWQQSLDRPVALKLVSSPTLHASERALWRFQREGRLLAALDHPAIVKVFEAGVHEGTPFLAMERIAGTSLAAALASLKNAGSTPPGPGMLRAAVLGAVAEDERGPATWLLPSDHASAVAAVGASIAEALACAHAAGVVHRDVKPSNILLRADGQALLVDFGVAHQDGAVALTAPGDLAGTPCYMSPEQARGEAVDAVTDVFSLGIVLFEALTLRLPFAGRDTGERLQRMMRGEAEDPRRYAPECSRDLAAIVQRALATQPKHRYRSAAEFAADLRSLLAGRPIQARPPGLAARTWRWARREPWRAMAAGAGAAVLGLLVVGDRIALAELTQESGRTAQALAEVQQLAIGVRLDRAREAAATLALARTTDLHHHEAWLRDHGEPLATARPHLARLLTATRAAALPDDDAVTAEDASQRERKAALRDLREELAWYEANSEVAEADVRSRRIARRDLLRREADKLAAEVEKRRSWRFADDRRQFLHDHLATLVADLDAFVDDAHGPLAAVRRGVAMAPVWHRRSNAATSPSWADVAADVAADPRFHGLRLAPQHELLPLGKNSQGYWEFVHLPSGAADGEIPARTAAGELRPGEDDGIVLVLLPAGIVSIGAQNRDPRAPHHDAMANDVEGPVVAVELAPFFCGKYELTQAQWFRLTGDDPSTYSRAKGFADASRLQPVETVSQERLRAALVRHHLDLPTEAQWEHACRAGSVTPWNFGERADAESFANFADRRAAPDLRGIAHEADLDDGHPGLAPIGSYAANAFGLHDMHGNAAELVADALAPRQRPRRPGRGEGVPNYPQRNVASRGGHCHLALAASRSASRGPLMAMDATHQFTGGRAVRAVEP